MSREDRIAMEEKIAAGEKAEKEKMKKEMKQKLKEKKEGFLKDFKKFITKGNVVDMAVGVVIGSAFSAIVNGLVKMVINPCIALIPGAKSLDNWKTVLQPAALEEAGNVTTAEVAILWGEWIQTIINFFIIALSIFVAVRIISGITRRLNAKKIAAENEAAEKKKAEEKAKADAAAAALAAEKAALANFYANAERQTALLEQLVKEK